MQEEGIIKFILDYIPGDAVDTACIASLNHWRTILFEYGLIGQSSDYLGGYGYGNVSQRFDETGTTGSDSFVISGTQTGGIRTLASDHYALVTSVDCSNNRVTATGPVKPSSESLTHGAVYQLSADIQCVLHVHSPVIWQAAERLDMPRTRADVAYGSPAMASEVMRLYQDADLGTQQIFSMSGHQDGVVAFGDSPEQAGMILIETLAACG